MVNLISDQMNFSRKTYLWNYCMASNKWFYFCSFVCCYTTNELLRDAHNYEYHRYINGFNVDSNQNSLCFPNSNVMCVRLDIIIMDFFFFISFSYYILFLFFFFLLSVQPIFNLKKYLLFNAYDYNNL